MRGAEGAVVGLVDRPGAVGVEEAVRQDLVVVWRLRGGLDCESCRTLLGGGSVDPFLTVEERHSRAAEREATGKAAGVRNVLAELRYEHGQVRHARGPDVLVSHATILS